MSGTTLSDTHPVDRDRSLASLVEVLSSRNRAILLAWVTPRLETPFSLTELSRAVDVPISSLQHECYKLERLGILQGRREGASRRYRVVLDHPLSRPLINLVIAALGLDAVLHAALADLGDIEAAVIAGDNAGTGRGRLILAIVGHASLEHLVQAQTRVALLLARRVDDIDLDYVQRPDWSPQHPLASRLAGRPLQRVVGAWPPPEVRPDPGEYESA